MPANNTQQAASLIVPGVYVDILPTQQSVQPLVNTALNAFVFGGNWGPVNTPIAGTGPSQFYSTFGYDTTSAYSAEDVFLTMPEDGQWVASRMTDGTDAKATISILGHNLSTTVATLTAAWTGSGPNGNANLGIAPATARIDLVSSTASGAATYNPVYRLTITRPFGQVEVYNNIVGYASLNTIYDAPTFKANLLAAVNGTLPNSVGSQNWVATTATGTLSPALATLFPATGGADGTSGLTDADMIGDDGVFGSRTGLYALRSCGAFHAAICGFTNLAYASVLSAFVESEGMALGFMTVPLGTTDAAAVQLRLANGVVYDNIALVKDFVQVFDPIAKTFRFVSPIGKAMGIVGLCPPEVSPIGQPYNITGNGAGYVIATENSTTPRSTSDLAALDSNGFLCITNQAAPFNGSFNLFDDVCSSGDPRANSGSGNYIPVVRMGTFLEQAFYQLGGPFIGKNQSPAANDPTRAAIQGSYQDFLNSLMPNGGTQRIAAGKATCDLTNNTPQTIAQGYCFVTILVQYLGVIRILYVTLQGGTAVQVSDTVPSQLQG